VQISDHDFASTQPINPLPGQPLGAVAAPQRSDKRLQQWLYTPPASTVGLLGRMLALRTALALLTPTVAGVVLGWWQSGSYDVATVVLLLSCAFCTILGMNLLNDNHDYTYSLKSNDGKFTQAIFATPYHLLAAGKIQSGQVSMIGYLLLLCGLIGHAVLVLLVGWPVLFFYTLSLLLIYTYTAPPVRYGYRGWGLGEMGLFLGYGFLPLLGSYFIVSRTIDWLPLWVSIPFGLLAVLVFFTGNLLHYRRDWLMRKRTLVVALGLLRTFDISALLTLVAYTSLLAIASLAHLPLSILVTLAALPLALGSFSRLRDEQPHLEDLFQLHLSTRNASIWTGVLFCAALLADKIFS
jgi:1,4-dihydroxy-2-naphthoate polyprenyltransferase